MKKKVAKKNAGVWLDHSKAVVVFIEGNQVEVKKFKSLLTRHHKATGGTRKALPYVYNGGVDDHKDEIKRRRELKKFYSKILDAVQGTNKLYIFGPSTAKFDLQNEFESLKKGNKVAIEAEDKLTERQIIAHVKKHYHALTGY